ncbi:MAG TPA: hypothetical protein VG755_12980 [Nannocystaceae bacterium]|nr:hypothetical protein [Nannocystaceae bacterium]
MKTHQLALVLAQGSALLSLACGSQPQGGTTDASNTNAEGSSGAMTTAPAETGEETSNPESTGSSGAMTTAPAETTDAEESEEGPKWDVGGAVDPGECEEAEAGIYCMDGVAVECDGNGNLVSSEECLPEICLQGAGCVTCLDGQYHCSGPRVMTCNADANPAHWVEIDVCNPQSNEACDQGTGDCVPAVVIGTNVPTGTYFKFADFPANGAFNGGYDVDGFDDKIYITSFNFGTGVDVYQVTLEDSDNDGMLEPNQHPDNPDDTGPIEERTILFLESIPGVTVSQSSSEILALEDRMYVSGNAVTEYVFGMGGSAVLTNPPPWNSWFAHLGYDDINGVWYASYEGQRRVLQWDEETNAWGIAFMYPDMAGDHMDGMEVVTDPNTGTPYVYVSDMTSDFIGQYRLDAELGWVQENLFQYTNPSDLVEGFGFGPLNHFWATGGSSLYELGGGDLATYTEPVPTG